ncbi:hypothetical protein [Jeotgalibacillus haloalkalitolerans]|uniref:DUF4064 domain-containing protein n=1 Tax=Jeotgalibacillus haloalkalitolerans TaxID=3104292 RepID=A0ABU5KQ43_9BACL|nr:hypothetical protein [Jeotgalibacillus sp. HH7-29]MDZ5713203.1 hypothetical protein [Jeotgalibacillus sp. HH7-29]
MKSKRSFWFTAGGYSIIILLITLAVTLNVYPGGYGYIYDESTQQLTLERGTFVKEDVTVEVNDDNTLRYLLFQDEVNRAIQSWVLSLTLGIFAVYLLQRVILAFQHRKEEGLRVKDILYAVLLLISLVMMVMLLISLSGSIQYLDQVFNTAAN